MQYAEEQGCLVGHADVGCNGLYVAGEGSEPPAIILPLHDDGLLAFWVFAHELFHLAHHTGPRGALLYGQAEARADRWAAQALIPRARIQAHGNASLDAFIAALSAHYEDLPLYDCPARRLAAHIAAIRLGALDDVA
jgi:hypothetical protein